MRIEYIGRIPYLFIFWRRFHKNKALRTYGSLPIWIMWLAFFGILHDIIYHTLSNTPNTPNSHHYYPCRFTVTLCVRIKRIRMQNNEFNESEEKKECRKMDLEWIKQNGTVSLQIGDENDDVKTRKKRWGKNIQFSNLILLTRQLMFYQQKHERITQICVQHTQFEQ